MLRALPLLLTFAVTTPAIAIPDRAETCSAGVETARIAAALLIQINETAQACVLDGAETLPCQQLADFIEGFDGRALIAALTTFQEGIIPLCAGPTR
jgi:hypothetical protein